MRLEGVRGAAFVDQIPKSGRRRDAIQEGQNTDLITISINSRPVKPKGPLWTGHFRRTTKSTRSAVRVGVDSSSPCRGWPKVDPDTRKAEICTGKTTLVRAVRDPGQ